MEGLLLIEDPGGEVLARMIWEALGSDAVPARRDQDNSPFGVNVPMEVKRDRV
jgi:hypothetical protein